MTYYSVAFVYWLILGLIPSEHFRGAALGMIGFTFGYIVFGASGSTEAMVFVIKTLWPFAAIGWCVGRFARRMYLAKAK
ncbi:hypothetical protein ABLN87_05820 [Ruegeria sp. SCPT10]|uniref:hypothetical protein n=1 Tax=Ruegeria sp. SCP10 TaxID=3141377 RepID=UPI003337C7DA